MLVKDNTKYPLTGKDMLQSFGQYNVGILLVRFIQLYFLTLRNPAGYNFDVISSLGSDNSFTATPNRVNFEDLPNEIHMRLDSGWDDYNIELRWEAGRRDDKLTRLSLDEDTGVISAHFSGNGKYVIKLSDGGGNIYTFSPRFPIVKKIGA